VSRRQTEASRGQGAWREGWHAGARHVPSPNFGPRPEGTAIQLAVLHSISLPPGEYGGAQIEQLFVNQLDWSAHPYFERIRGIKVSAHFVIRRSGEMLQFVSVLQRAWHAGVSSWNGRANVNDHSIGIELEGLEGEAFDDRQYPVLAALLRDCAAMWPVAEVVGHEHVAPGRKADPGAGFDWARLRRRLRWAAARFPATPV
jgi:N-acetyl-anhydromuramoyl-L-alanine amidase